MKAMYLNMKGNLDQILQVKINYENDKHDEFAATNDLESWKRKVTL